MSNVNLINSMLKCDGTRMNCKGCTFAEHPECRNAMAHHAGALIQLQDVVIENSGRILNKVANEREGWKRAYEASEKAKKEAMEMLSNIHRGLSELKHCESCQVKNGEGFTEEEKKAHCEACRNGGAGYIFDLAFGLPPEEETDEDYEVDDEYDSEDDE